MNELKIRAHVFVSGQVQGVFFRSETSDEARKHHVKGWVHNLPDGRVEAVFEGEERDVEALIEFCKQGPPGAKVIKTDAQWESYSGEFGDFAIRY